MPSEGFLTNLHAAMLFFRICRRYKLSSREDRIALMRKLAKRGEAKYLRDVEAFAAGKTVLRITKKREYHNEN